jgi:dynein light chain Tctex-type 1
MQCIRLVRPSSAQQRHTNTTSPRTGTPPSLYVPFPPRAWRTRPFQWISDVYICPHLLYAVTFDTNISLTPMQQNILQSLIDKTSTTGTDNEKTQPPYKYIVNSTVIQHIGSPSEPEKHGRRGMHSAVGAYWNNEKDGTYSYKWEGAEKKGMDIVIAITWVAI